MKTHKVTFPILYTLDLDIDHGILIKSPNYPNHIILAKAYLCLNLDDSDNRVEFTGPTDSNPGLTINKKVISAIQCYLLEMKPHESRGYKFKKLELVPVNMAEQMCSVLSNLDNNYLISPNSDYLSDVDVIVCGTKPTFLVRKDFINEESSSREFVVRKRGPKESGFYAGTTLYSYWFMVEGKGIEE